ncbi:PE family protein, partial [Mycobacterium kansasii 824]
MAATTDMLAAAGADLARIGSALEAANLAAAAQTTRVLAAGADEVSAAIAALFSENAQTYQAISAQAATFHSQFVHRLHTSAQAYAAAEANAERTLLHAVNAPTQTLLGRPLIGNGADATTPGQPGGDGGLLCGNGGAGYTSTIAGMAGTRGGNAGLLGNGGPGGAGGQERPAAAAAAADGCWAMAAPAGWAAPAADRRCGRQCGIPRQWRHRRDGRRRRRRTGGVAAMRDSSATVAPVVSVG